MGHNIRYIYLRTSLIWSMHLGIVNLTCSIYCCMHTCMYNLLSVDLAIILNIIIFQDMSLGSYIIIYIYMHGKRNLYWDIYI